MKPRWKIFVISLRRVRERRLQILHQLLPRGLPFELVDAVDARQLKPELLVREEDASEMPDGAWACYQSHIGIFERIIDYGLDYGVILEDDCVLLDSGKMSLANIWEKLPADADHIQLHGLKGFLSKGYRVEEEGEYFNKLACTNVFTVGYIVSRRLADFILTRHRKPRMAPDLLFVAISKLGKFNFYDVSEKLVEPNWRISSSIEVPPEPPGEEPPPRVLCYTLALDLKDTHFYSQQARMMVASLKRSGFRGDFKLIHNGEFRIFEHPDPKIEEIRIDAPETTAQCYQMKFRARDLFSVDDYDWVLFLDTDFIFSIDIDSWFTGPEVIRFATEPAFPITSPQFNGFLTDDEMAGLERRGINSGAFVIRADHYHEVMTLWEELDAGESSRCKIGDQHAWNRLLLDTGLTNRELSTPEIKCFYDNANFNEMLTAGALHFCGCKDGDKLLAMQAKFISHFHTDNEGSLVRILER